MTNRFISREEAIYLKRAACNESRRELLNVSLSLQEILLLLGHNEGSRERRM